MDREAWRAVVHGVAKSRTWLSDWTELKILHKNPNERFGQPNTYNRILFFLKKEWNPKKKKKMKSWQTKWINPEDAKQNKSDRKWQILCGATYCEVSRAGKLIEIQSGTGLTRDWGKREGVDIFLMGIQFLFGMKKKFKNEQWC